MNTRPLVFSCLLAVSSLTFATLGSAQSTGDEATTNMARARFKEGVKYFDKGQFELARAAFLQAYALKKHPAILLNLGWSCLKSGHTLEANRYFKEFLSETGAEVTDKQRADANDGLRQTRTALGQIDVVASAGATVTVDGENVGVTPLSEPVAVDVGSHTVSVRWPDGAVETQSLSTTVGVHASAHFTKPAPPVAPPPPAATAQAVPPPAPPAPPPAPVATEPPQPPPSSPESLPNGPQESAAPQGNRWTTAPVYIGVGVALASAGVAIGALVSKQSAQDNANTELSDVRGYKIPPYAPGGYPGGSATSCTLPNGIGPQDQTKLAHACNIYNGDISQVDQDATLGNVAIVVGVAAVVGTIAYGIVELAHNSSVSRLVLTPTIGRSEGGLSILGAF
jgi:hypothetical protein